MIYQYAVYSLVCYLVLYMAMKFPLFSWLGTKWNVLDNLFGCPLCFGVWISFILALVFQINFFDGWFYFIGVSEFITGIITSYVLYVFKAGWDTLFKMMVIE